MSRTAILQSPLAITAVGIAALITVGACVPTRTSSPHGSGSLTTMCSLISPPPPSGTSPPTSAPGPAANVTGMVGVILPNTTPPTPYPRYDAPLLEKAVDADGISSDVIGTPFPLPYC